MAESARVILDSISPWGDRLTTVEFTLWRPLIAEFNTHRSHSRNSSSTRAIPLKRAISATIADPAIPLFHAAKPGMQAGPPLEGENQEIARQLWLRARDQMVTVAQAMDDLGIHKSEAGRLLEPFGWQTVVASATTDGWDNFFAQRATPPEGDPQAQYGIRVVADLIRDAMANSTPVVVHAGEWHLPYITDEERRGARSWAPLIRASVARCARVSYLRQGEESTPEQEEALFRRLVTATPPHWSPLEHVATPTLNDREHEANFHGWTQLRHYPTKLPSYIQDARW